MNTVNFIKQLVSDLHEQVDIVLKDTTDEQFNWAPGGTVNPMSAIAVHILAAEDDFIHAVLQHKPPCWETGNWKQEIGAELPPGPDQGWGGFKGIHIRIKSVMAYKQMIQAETDAFLAKIVETDLEREVILFGATVPASDVFKLLIVHSLCHIGEMDALKGQQGTKVLPY